MHIENTPFTILALGSFSPGLETDSPPLLSTDPLSVDAALEQLRPSLDIPVDKAICPAGSLTVSFSRMADFRPQKICKNCMFIKQVLEALDFLKKGNPPSALAENFPGPASLIDIPDPVSPSRSSDSALIDDILSMVEIGKQPAAPESSKSVESQLRTIHKKLLGAVFEDPGFRKLEAAWRGVELLAGQVPSGSITTVNLLLLPLSGDLDNLLDNLETELADSPPDLILIDCRLSNSPRSMEEIERIMNFAETMLSPAFFSTGPNFFEIPEWNKFKTLPFIPSLLEQAEYGRWKTLRTESSAGWIVPCTGEVVARPVYGQEAGYTGASFTEAEPLFYSSIWAMGGLCAAALAGQGRTTCFANRSIVRLEGMPLTEGRNPSPLYPDFNTERIKDLRLAGISALSYSGDQVFALHSTAMDGSPLNLKLFLSRMIHELIRLSAEKSDEFRDLEQDLSRYLSLFIQKQGLPDPGDIKVETSESQEGGTPLLISFTPDREILDSDSPISFGFNW